MVDLAYNNGVSAFHDSTLVRLFNAGDQAGAAEQFPRWNKSGGKVLLGAVPCPQDGVQFGSGGVGAFGQ